MLTDTPWTEHPLLPCCGNVMGAERRGDSERFAWLQVVCWKSFCQMSDIQHMLQNARKLVGHPFCQSRLQGSLKTHQSYLLLQLVDQARATAERPCFQALTAHGQKTAAEPQARLSSFPAQHTADTHTYWICMDVAAVCATQCQELARS